MLSKRRTFLIICLTLSVSSLFIIYPKAPDKNNGVAERESMFTTSPSLPNIRADIHNVSIKVLNTKSPPLLPKKEAYKPSVGISYFLRIRGIGTEEALSTKGGPMNPLPNFQNPCWMSSYSKQAVLSRRPYDTSKGDAFIYSRSNYHHSKWMKQGKAYMDYAARRLAKGENWRMRCMPGVYIAGISKCGTTELHTLLVKHHPDIYLPFVKEPHWWKFRKSLTTYLDNYDGAADSLYKKSLINKQKGIDYHKGLTLDSSSRYMYHFPWKYLVENRKQHEPKVVLAHYLKAYNPNTKVIVLLRNPTDRLYSHYKMNLGRKPIHNVAGHFHSRIVLILRRLNNCLAKHSQRYCAYNFLGDPFGLAAGMYYIYIKDWKAVFGENMIVIQAEKFYGDPVQTIKDVSTFLNISQPSLRVSSQVDASKKKSKKKSSMLGITRALLNKFYEPFNKKLASFLHSDAFLWK